MFFFKHVTVGLSPIVFCFSLSEFAKSMGLPDLSKLKDVFNFNMNDVTVNKVLGYLDKIGLSKLKTSIIKILKELEVGHLCY